MKIVMTFVLSTKLDIVLHVQGIVIMLCEARFKNKFSQCIHFRQHDSKTERANLLRCFQAALSENEVLTQRNVRCHIIIRPLVWIAGVFKKNIASCVWKCRRQSIFQDDIFVFGGK